MKNIPNILSVSRIFLSILLLIIYPLNNLNGFNISIAIIIIASLTDYLDGRIARKMKIFSKRGYIWDGLGDRSMYIALLLIFFTENRIGIIFLWALIFREVSLYALRVITNNWLETKYLRRISLVYVILLRGWFIANLLLDAEKYYSWKYDFNFPVYSIMTALLVTTIIVGYYGLLRYLEILFSSNKK